jgi:hypothetical protein
LSPEDRDNQFRKSQQTKIQELLHEFTEVQESSKQHKDQLEVAINAAILDLIAVGLVMTAWKRGGFHWNQI